MKKIIFTLAIVFASLFSFSQIKGSAGVAVGSGAFMAAFEAENNLTYLKGVDSTLILV